MENTVQAWDLTIFAFLIELDHKLNSKAKYSLKWILFFKVKEWIRKEIIFLETELLGDFSYSDLLFWPQRWCQQLGHWAVTAEHNTPQTQQVHCPPRVAQHAPLRVPSLVPAQLCMAKSAVILLHISREVLLRNYWWKKRLLQSGCQFWGMCCHGLLVRRETSPVFERMWHYERATCPKSLALGPRHPQCHVTLSFVGWQQCFKYFHPSC